MTSISQSISFVRGDVCSPRHAARFEEGRARQDALAAYPTATALVEAIERDRKRDYERSEPVAQALIDEHRRDRDTLWSSLLLLLCKPLLLNLRDEIAGQALPREEVDQLTLVSFAEAVSATAAAPRAGQTFSQLRTLTRRAVLRAVTAAQREQTQTELIEPERLRELVDGERRSDRRLLEHAQARTRDDESPAQLEESAQIAALKKYGSALLKGDLIDMLIHTVIRGGRLIDFVDAAHPTSSEEERRRHYAREKRRHARAVALMRTVLAPLRRKKWAQPTDGAATSGPRAAAASDSGPSGDLASDTSGERRPSDRPAPTEADGSATAERREMES